jgi:hypothetical protein
VPERRVRLIWINDRPPELRYFYSFIHDAMEAIMRNSSVIGGSLVIILGAIIAACRSGNNRSKGD